MEIVTEKLHASKLESELRHLIQWMERNGIQELCVTFGVGYPGEPLWTPIPVAVRDLQSFVDRAVQDGSFRFGQMDLTLYGAASVANDENRAFRCEQRQMRFTFCHESDMHFESEDAALVEDVKRQWRARGYAGYESATTDQSRHWVRF